MLVKTDPRFPTTPAVQILLQEPFFVLVDPSWFDRLIWLPWYAKKSRGKFYACRKVTENGSVFFVRMHRVIADTPVDLVCHHINRNSLDNRRANLQNMSWFEHAKYYSYR